MKPRDFLNFLKTKSGKLVVFGALFAGGLIIFSVLRQHHTASKEAVAVTPLATNGVSDKPEVVQTIVLPMQVFNPPPPPKFLPPPASPAHSMSSPPTFTNLSPQPLQVVPPRQLPQLSPISLFADSAAGVARPKKLSAPSVQAALPALTRWGNRTRLFLAGYRHFQEVFQFLARACSPLRHNSRASDSGYAANVSLNHAPRWFLIHSKTGSLSPPRFHAQVRSS